MKTSVATTAPETTSAGLLAVGIPELDGKLPAALAAIDKALHGEMGRAMTAGDFAGKTDESALFYPADGPQRVLLVGLGAPDALNGGAVRKAAAVAGRRATSAGAESMAVYIPPDVVKTVGAAAVAQAVVEGAGQGGWTFEQLRSKRESRSDLTDVIVVGTDADRDALERGRAVGDAMAHGQALARSLQMRPGNHCTPADLAGEAEALGKRHGIAVSIMDLAQIRKEGLNALLAVAQGSAEEPRFITLEYKGNGKSAPVCLVGKGVTFDSGGISIKPALNMEEMKYDMSGAAAVLGTFEALGRLKPKLNVVGLIPATENLPSSTAVKPGDVVTTHFGKTVEIVNTDAEGRLILCDALSYARRFDPACIIDAATLTGAIVIALGDQATGLMGTDDALIAEITKAGGRAGEPCWELPLWDGYRAQIKSGTADIKNVGGRPAGSITAGWFLKEFIEDHPWAHLDIAGTAWIDQDRPDVAKGPTGVGVRLFTEFLLGRAAG